LETHYRPTYLHGKYLKGIIPANKKKIAKLPFLLNTSKFSVIGKAVSKQTPVRASLTHNKQHTPGRQKYPLKKN